MGQDVKVHAATDGTMHDLRAEYPSVYPVELRGGWEHAPRVVSTKETKYNVR